VGGLTRRGGRKGGGGLELFSPSENGVLLGKRKGRAEGAKDLKKRGGRCYFPKWEKSGKKVQYEAQNSGVGSVNMGVFSGPDNILKWNCEK